MRLSFCTTCKNRLHHLEKTIFDNLKLIERYNAELVLVNYDSKDSLDFFVNTQLTDYIKNGTMKYIVVPNKQYFKHSHAKNIAHRNASGDVLVNLDSDNYLTDYFMRFIISLFSNNINSCTVGQLLDCNGGYGRIAISKNNFYKLGGYIESLKGYGYEDCDFVERAYLFLKCPVTILDVQLTPFIDHTNMERTKDVEIKFKKTSNDLNKKSSKIYQSNNIINPNEFEGIDFGMIDS